MLPSVSGACHAAKAKTPELSSCCAWARPRAASSWSSRRSSTILWPLTPPAALTLSKYAFVPCALATKLMAPVCVTIDPTLMGAPSAMRAADTPVADSAVTPLLPPLVVVVVRAAVPAVPAWAAADAAADGATCVDDSCGAVVSTCAGLSPRPRTRTTPKTPAASSCTAKRAAMMRSRPFSICAPLRCEQHPQVLHQQPFAQPRRH